jgi:hypothetical protein
MRFNAAFIKFALTWFFIETASSVLGNGTTSIDQLGKLYKGFVNHSSSVRFSFSVNNNDPQKAVADDRPSGCT